MKLAFRSVLTLSLLLVANAHAETNMYVSAGGGWSFPNKNTNASNPSNFVIYSPTSAGTGIFKMPSVTWYNSYQSGSEADIALGMIINPHWRVDSEFLYQHVARHVSGVYSLREYARVSGNTFSSSSNNSIPEASTHANIYSLLVNGYYDFRCKNYKLVPSLGVGVGVASIHSPKTTAYSNLVINNATTHTNSTVAVVENSPALHGKALAYQLKAGLAYEFNKNLSLSLIYRAFATTEFEASSSSIKTGRGKTNFRSATYTIRSQNTSSMLINNVGLDLKYAF